MFFNIFHEFSYPFLIFLTLSFSLFLCLSVIPFNFVVFIVARKVKFSNIKQSGENCGSFWGIRAEEEN